MKISQIKKLPVLHGNTHESIYRSYHTLKLVKDMLERGDSSRTIIEVIELINEKEIPDTKLETK